MTTVEILDALKDNVDLFGQWSQNRLSSSDVVKKLTEPKRMSNNKQETLEEASERIFTPAYTNYKVRRQGFIEGAVWQAERMYSKEELKQALIMAKETVEEGGKDLAKYSILTILDEFKKK